jgi:hypothetical protein
MLLLEFDKTYLPTYLPTYQCDGRTLCYAMAKQRACVRKVWETLRYNRPREYCRKKVGGSHSLYYSNSEEGGR